MALLAGLLVLLGTGGASAGILTVKDTGRNSTLGPFAVAPAAFGPAIDKAGVHGLLEAARPLEACQKPMDVSSNSTILLVRRSEPWERTCPFINKVRNAEAAGAKAAVVFDYIGESLLIMSKESTEKARHSDFHSLLTLLSDSNSTEETDQCFERHGTVARDTVSVRVGGGREGDLGQIGIASHGPFRSEAGAGDGPARVGLDAGDLLCGPIGDIWGSGDVQSRTEVQAPGAGLERASRKPHAGGGARP